MMEEGQNDYPLAKAVKEWGGYPHTVKNWEDTRTQLKKFVVQLIMYASGTQLHSLI